jgi:hypothetical protein
MPRPPDDDLARELLDVLLEGFLIVGEFKIIEKTAENASTLRSYLPCGLCARGFLLGRAVQRSAAASPPTFRSSGRTRLADRGHEVGVAVPPGDDVDVQVIEHACSAAAD